MKKLKYNPDIFWSSRFYDHNMGQVNKPHYKLLPINEYKHRIYRAARREISPFRRNEMI